MITSPIKAVLIDFDGTLFDTDLANASAYHEAILFFGFTISVEQLAGLIRGRHHSIFLPEILGKTCNPFLMQKITTLKRKIYPNYFSLIQPNVGLITLVKELNTKGFKLGVVTNASKSSVNSVLDYFNLLQIFQVIVSSDNVSAPKPAKECYEYAMNAMNVSPEQCIAFEDSDVGVASAQNAGIKVIRVSTSQ